MNLYFRQFGQGIPLIILHGLYGSSDNWLTVARALSADYRVFIPDLRNHGRSPHSPVHTYPAMCADIIELMDHNDIEQCMIIGHSMGGKVAMHVASAVPHRVLKLVIDDIAPVSYSSLSEFSSLALEHLNIVDTLLHTDLSLYARREDIEQTWKEHIPDADIRRFLLKNIQRNDGNRYSWRLNVQSIARNLPHILNGMDGPGYGKSQKIELPALFLKGELSIYIQPENFALIRQIFTDVQITVIPHAGHWLHVEQPGQFLSEVRRFFNKPA